MTLMWKEAATVILTSLKTVKNNSVFNYYLMCIKRSAKNSFMPGMYVFPGGTADEADSSERWLEMFSKFNIKLDTKLVGAIPPILTNNEILKLVSLKITAIRETFEETGILLCTQGKKSNIWTSCFVNEDLSDWRSKVEKDASEFYNLCEHFNCCPDINGLHLWSNWLTPRNRNKRYDTVFFMATLADIPSSAADKNEIDEIVWHPPNWILEKNEQNQIVLAPPQVYEISRLLNFTDCNELLKFARERVPLGCDRWVSYYLKAKDGIVLVLPGDEAYKDDCLEGINVPLDVIEMTVNEFQSKFGTLHRIEGKKIIIKNYKPKNGHLLPVSNLVHSPISSL